MEIYSQKKISFLVLDLLSHIYFLFHNFVHLKRLRFSSSFEKDLESRYMSKRGPAEAYPIIKKSFSGGSWIHCTNEHDTRVKWQDELNLAFDLSSKTCFSSGRNRSSRVGRLNLSVLERPRIKGFDRVQEYR